MMPLAEHHLEILSAFLFASGMVIIISKKNAIMVLLGIELLFNAANLNLIVFGQMQNDPNPEMFAIFVIVIAVCEAAVGLAIILRVYHYYRTIAPDNIREIKEQ